MDQSFKTFDDLIVRKSQHGHIQAQHLGDYFPEVYQLQANRKTLTDRANVLATAGSDTITTNS